MMTGAQDGCRMPKSHIAEVVDLGTPITKFRKQPTICRDRKFEVMASVFRQRCEHALDAAIEAATGDMERGHGSGARVPRVPRVPMGATCSDDR